MGASWLSQVDFSSPSEFSEGSGGGSRPWSAPVNMTDRLPHSSLTAMLTGNLSPYLQHEVASLAAVTMDASHIQGTVLYRF